MGEESDSSASISISDDRKPLLVPSPETLTLASPSDPPPPTDHLSLGYLIYFTLGAGFLLPWNAFITAVDYFSYLYPSTPIDRVFSVSYMFACFLPLLFIVVYAHKSSAALRINSGLSLFTLALLIVPVMDAVYVKGRQGLYLGYDVTVAATALCGLADALVQGGVIGSAGELPERYMQATVAGTAASGEICRQLGGSHFLSGDLNPLGTAFLDPTVEKHRSTLRSVWKTPKHFEIGATTNPNHLIKKAGSAFLERKAADSDEV